MSKATDRAKWCRGRAEQCRAWAELTTHQAAKEGFTQVANEWDSLAVEIEQINLMRKFTESTARAAGQIHVD